MKRVSDDPSAPRARLDQLIVRLGMGCFHRPILTLLAFILIVAASATQLPKTHFVTDVDLLLRADHPDRIAYDRLREQFGRNDIILITLTPPDVFDLQFLLELRSFHERLENELPWIDEVQSLVNARYTHGRGDTLIVGELLEEWPETPDALEAVEALARSNPFYRNFYLSGDGRTTGILIRPLTYEPTEFDPLELFEEDESEQESADASFLSDARIAELAVAVDEIVATSDFGDVPIYVAGDPVLNTRLQRLIAEDMVRYSGFAFAAIAILLLLVFGRVSAVLLPLVLVAFAVVATLGGMAAAGRPLTFLSQIVPPFILAVGVGFAVHVLAIFFQGLDRGDARAAAAEGALRHSGTAIAMSSVTTSGGMLSFLGADLIPIRDIGIFVPFGVMFSAALALLMLPALLALLPLAPKTVSGPVGGRATERILAACGRLATRRPVAMLVGGVTVFVVAAAGIPRLTSDYDILTWFPESDPMVTAIEHVDATMGGAGSLEIMFDSGRENGLHDPEVLRRIEAIQRYAETEKTAWISIEKTVSVADVVKEINQALHEGDPDHQLIVDDRRLIAQELLLFESAGSDDLEDLVDSQFRLARISMKSNQAGGNRYLGYLRQQGGAMREIAEDAELTFSGLFVLGSTVSQLTTTTAIRSYAIAFLVITPLMVLFIGSIRTGLVSMAPNLMPILIVTGVMGWTGAPIDLLTALIGGIALGLVVDDTIHILHGFRREYMLCGDVEQATERVMQTTGRALLFTTLVLSCAFSIFGFSETGTLSNFGLLTSLAIVLAFLFDVFVSPALLALLYRGRGRGVEASSG